MIKSIRMGILTAAACAAVVLAVPLGFHALAAEAVAVAPTAAPAAAAQVVVADVSWWQTLWAQVQAPLIALVSAIFAAVGIVITTTVRRYAGEGASQAVNSVYQTVADQAAGWLVSQLHGALPSSSAASPTAVHPPIGGNIAVTALNSAISYAKQSYPDVLAKLDVHDNELGKDIVAAAGKLISKGSVLPNVAQAIGGLISRL